jgi:succinate-semialdehyde dehydrogenase / glutarate-semialdehyde dehydrogenase
MAVATQEQQVVDAVEKRLYIGGEWRDATGGASLPVEDPSTEETIAEVADATPDDAKAALDAAVAMQKEWGETPANKRSEILYDAFALIGERADELAVLMTLEMGKPVSESKAEISYSAEFFRWFSGQALRTDGYYKPAGNGAGRVLVMRQPVGPSYMITPWNFPMAMGTRKIGPAIAAGCTMVMKHRSRRCRCSLWRRSSRRWGCRAAS